MAKVDYVIQRRSRLSASELASLPECDLLISAYNNSERVNTVFSQTPATTKHWLIHPEYEFNPTDYPAAGAVFASTSRNEAQFLVEYFQWAGDLSALHSLRIDITGFMRPHLMLLAASLFEMGFERFEVLYSDPVLYRKEEKTEFTRGAVSEVRQVSGFEGVHVPDAGTSDLLIIGTGYDDRLIKWVAESKEAARKIEMYGLPSLQPDMYQENVLRSARAADSVGLGADVEPMFAPANDPFTTAQVLHERVEVERRRGLQNLYLCPVGTKVQALGFALYYLHEWRGLPCSVIFPFAESYDQETSLGLSRAWLYTVEKLPWYRAA